MFDISIDEMREELVLIQGMEIYEWTEEEILDEYEALKEYADVLDETDFSAIDEVDNEFHKRYQEWN